MPNPTIYDVAQLAGVSIATVSRVLNNPDQVKPVTRSRILAAIDSLKFIPKVDAVARARKGYGRIGIITPSLTDDSFVDRLRGVVMALDGGAYESVLYLVNSPAQRDGLANLALNQSVDGLIVMGIALEKSTIDRFSTHHVPLVLLADKQLAYEQPINQIVIDHGAGARMVADHLLECGHRRIAFIGDAYLNDHSNPIGGIKLDHFRQRLAEKGVPLPDVYVRLASQSMEQARLQAHALLTFSEPPTAIFASSDTQAIGIISAARERGLAIPDDLAIFGFDDISIAQFLELSTIHQSLKESGHLAVEFVIAAIEGKATAPQYAEMPLKLMQRTTC